MKTNIKTTAFSPPSPRLNFTPSSPLLQRCRVDWRGYGQHTAVSLFCFFPHIFPWSGMGFLWATVPSGISTCPSVASFMVCSVCILYGLHGGNLLHCNLLPGLQGISSPVPGAPPPLMTLVILLLFFILFVLSSSIYPALFKCIFPEVPPAWLRGSDVPYGRSAGAVWKHLCPRKAALGPPHRVHPIAPQCQHRGT